MMKKFTICLFTAALSFAFLLMPAFPEALGGGMAARGTHGGFPGGYQWKPFHFPMLAGGLFLPVILIQTAVFN